MKILITGATGFIGNGLTSYLLGKGHTIHYLTTQSKKIQNSTRYHGFSWDPAKEIIDIRCLEGVEAIIHLAGESIMSPWTTKGKRAILESRERTASLLFKTLEESEHEVKHIVCASAIGIYSDGEDWQTESDFTAATDFLGEVVVKWEHASQKFESLGIKVALIRIGMVLLRNGGALPEMIKPIKNYVGAPLGNGAQFYSWIHIDDMIRLFSFALQHQLTGVYNGVASEPVRNKDLTQQLARKLNKPIWLPRVPQWLLKMVLGEKTILVLTSQRISNQKILNEGFEFKYPDLKLALQNLLGK